MPHRFATLCLILTTIGGAVPARSADASRDDVRVTFAATVEFGADRGQRLGSLFEARDAEGRVVASAGFHDAYNTHFRTDRHTLQLYVRPAGESAATMERLPSPDLGFGVYLFDIGGELYAWSSVAGKNVRFWDEAAGTWRAEFPPGMTSCRQGDGITRIGSAELSCASDGVRCDGGLILGPPEVGGYFDYHYANGHLCFYNRHRADDGGFTHVVACPWVPGDGPIDLARAIVLDTKYDFETTFAWGQFDDQVITVGNTGGVYVLDQGTWRVVREPDRNISYQIYSMLRWRDRLLMAQYPTGHIFEYRGEAPVEVPDWPPRLEGVASSARECQTLAIYNGELFAGVWPWAELWRLADGSTWRSHGRLFSHPQLTSAATHPYEPESESRGFVLNHWGQRVSGMVPLGDSLYLATSAKGTGAWPENADFLSAEQKLEYGAVLRLRMPGNLATQFRWRGGRTELEFVVGAESLSIRQDGVELASTTLPGGSSLRTDDLHVVWGDGPHGPSAAQSLAGRWIAQPRTGNNK